MSVAEPKTPKQLRGFVGMVNYYKSLWPRRSATMAPLTELTGKGVPFKWTTDHSKAFKEVKNMIAQDAMLVHPNFNKPFVVQTDASKEQIGGVVSQDDKPIGFFSRKLSKAQLKYTVMEKELLGIVETLKYFRNILLGNKVIIYTDHKNITYDSSNFDSDRILRQRLLIEEFGAELRYIKGENNVVADALSRLPMTVTKISDEAFLNRRVFQDTVVFPLDLAHLKGLQDNDNQLLRLLRDRKNSKVYQEDMVNGIKLWTVNKRVYVPKEGREPLIQWYHENLQHAGPDRTALTMRQHFEWPGMVEQIKNYIKKCPICQKKKITGVKKYGKVPFVEGNTDVPPFHTVHLDMIGPWKIKFLRGGKKIALDILALTMVDKATNWPEIASATNKESAHVSTLFDKNWLCRYPRPVRVIHDNGGEFTGFEFQELCSSYGVKAVPTTVKNPRSNSAAERMHLTAGDMLRTMIFSGENWQVEVDIALQSVAWALRSTLSTMSGYSPGQLVFSRDMIMQNAVTADWEKIKQLKRDSAIRSNIRENASRVPYDYKVGDKILILIDKDEVHSKLSQPTEGPYEIVKVHRHHDTVKIARGAYLETIHIRRIKPFHE